MTNAKSLLGSRAWGPEQSKQEPLLKVVRERGGMTENRHMAVWHNFRNHTCSQEEQMYQDTLQGD